MKMYVFEGTPEEIAKVAGSMNLGKTWIKDDITKSSGNGVSRFPKSDESPGKFVTEDFAVHAMTRLELSQSLFSVLKKLFDTKTGFVSSDELYTASQYTPPQFAGMMGAFGRRMFHTKNYDEEAHFWDWQEASDGSWEYRLPTTVRNAIEKVGIENLRPES